MMTDEGTHEVIATLHAQLVAQTEALRDATAGLNQLLAVNAELRRDLHEERQRANDYLKDAKSQTATVHLSRAHIDLINMQRQLDVRDALLERVMTFLREACVTEHAAWVTPTLMVLDAALAAMRKGDERLHEDER